MKCQNCNRKIDGFQFRVYCFDCLTDRRHPVESIDGTFRNPFRDSWRLRYTELAKQELPPILAIDPGAKAGAVFFDLETRALNRAAGKIANFTDRQVAFELGFARAWPVTVPSQPKEQPIMKSKVETGEFLALICKAARERFAEDITAPGVQVAHVTKPEGNVFYVALHRYPNNDRDSYGARGKPEAGHTRVVVLNTTQPDLDDALGVIAAYLVPSTSAQAELASACKVAGK
jgi:hypothetical protein